MISVASLILLWHILVYFNILNAVFLPSPFVIGKEFILGIKDGSLLIDIAMSLQRVVIGFGLASLAGITLGILLGHNRLIAILATPIVDFFRPIPPIAWIPLAILWFGLGDKPAYFLVFMGAFFPIFTNTYFGIISVENIYKRAALSLGAGKTKIITQVLLPGALPHIFTGLRIGLGVGWLTVIAAELVGAQSGLGYMIQFSRLLLDTTKVVTGMVAIGLVGYLMNKTMIFLEKKLIPWRKTL